MAQESNAAKLHAFFRKEEALVQEVARRGLRSVPPAYVLPALQRPRLSELAHSSVRPPVVDLSLLQGAGRADCIALIRRACEEWGFFQVMNHGASQEVIDEMWAAGERFFHLPPRERMQCYEADDRNPQGVSDNATLGWRETVRFRGIWDPADRLPTFCRDPLERYQEEMAKVALKLNVAMMESLGVNGKSAIAMRSNVAKKGISMHLYPPCPDPSVTLGLAAHQDITSFTILLETENIGGLQILHNGQWVNHIPLKGSLSIILGEQIKRLSNGMYQNVLHRVVTQSFQQRMSIATFFLPPPNTKIHALPHLVDAFHPPKFQDLAICDTFSLASKWFN